MGCTVLSWHISTCDCVNYCINRIVQKWVLSQNPFFFLNFSSNNSLRNSSRVINHGCELTIKQSHLRSHIDKKKDSIAKTSNNGIDINPKSSPGQHHEENGWKVKLKTKVFLVLESSQKFEIVSEGFTTLPRHKHSSPSLKFLHSHYL